jgi:hypothetical protein
VLSRLRGPVEVNPSNSKLSSNEQTEESSH